MTTANTIETPATVETTKEAKTVKTENTTETVEQSPAFKHLTPARIAKLTWDKGMSRIDELAEQKKAEFANKHDATGKEAKKEVQTRINKLDAERFAIVDQLKEKGDKVGGWALGRTGKRHSLVIRYKAKA